MITLEDIVTSLEQKIQQYRKGQKVVFLLSTYLQDSKHQFSGQKQNLSHNISNQISELKQQATERMTAVAAFAENLIARQKNIYQEEIHELRNEISRQYKVITLMRQELQDLMNMLNERKAEGIHQKESENQETEEEGRQNRHSEDPSQTINGLEVIEEEDTDRTVMSSVHSFTEEGKFNSSDKFIKIEEREIDEPSQHQDFSDPSSNLPTEERLSHPNTNQSDQWGSNCRFQKLLESEASRRHQTYLGELHTQEIASQWQSMPLSAEGSEFGRGNQSWQCGASLKELRQITNQNQNEKDRQTKTKMFLQQFRKTFNKCLSSANVSRKTSKNNMSKPPKDKSKTMIATFGKVDTELSSNEKLITQMLRDIDNNNKFAVGTRRSELKYEGEKKEGLRCGQGVLYYSNGLSYEGEFKNNLRHGYGILRFNQIQIYRGEWSNDELTGQGKIRNFAVINKRKNTSSSSILNRWVSYCGSFRGNRFEGEGTLYLQGGQKFLGRFICGSACGQGTLYRKSGEVESGVWRHNQLVQQF